MVKRTFNYKDPKTGSTISVTVEWPDNANTSPPASVIYSDIEYWHVP